MLACIPAVRAMTVKLYWRLSRYVDNNKEEWEVKNVTGVTVWDLVDVVRGAPADIESILRTESLSEIEDYI